MNVLESYSRALEQGTLLSGQQPAERGEPTESIFWGPMPWGIKCLKFLLIRFLFLGSYSNQLCHLNSTYTTDCRVFHLFWEIGWVDFDFDVPLQLHKTEADILKTRILVWVPLPTFRGPTSQSTMSGLEICPHPTCEVKESGDCEC